jgi:UbiD family decarboxylase
MECPRDLREFLKRLDERGKLYRFSDPINKDTELYPVFRVQQRGLPDHERKALLFDNVHGAKGNHYDMSVFPGAYAASEEMLMIGFGCDSYQEGLERWHQARSKPIEPAIVDRGPVQQTVMMGDDLKKVGLDIFPVPVEEPGFSGMLRLGLPFTTKDPETGERNTGAYNAFFKARDRMQAAPSPGSQSMVYHWRKARARGEPLPVAIVIGPDLPTMGAASASLPYGVDEFAVAGGFFGAPLEMVRCKTVPLEVPAHAEAIVEGLMSTTMAEPRLPFGEYPGYIHSDLTVRPVLNITAITYRDNPIFTPVLVGMPPSDTSMVWGFVHAGDLLHRLKHERGLKVAETYYPQDAGGSTFCVVRMDESATPEDGVAIFEELQKGRGAGSRYTIIVDHDIDVRDADTLIWALTFRAARQRDFSFLPTGGGGLDPSGSPAGNGHGVMSAQGTEPDFVRITINATRKWAYPPVALPRKQYMDRALRIWEGQKGLPRPRMRTPWYGYELGFWTDELQHYADLITGGDYLKLGAEMEEYQVPITEEMIGPNTDRTLGR